MSPLILADFLLDYKISENTVVDLMAEACPMINDFFASREEKFIAWPPIMERVVHDCFQSVEDYDGLYQFIANILDKIKCKFDLEQIGSIIDQALGILDSAGQYIDFLANEYDKTKHQILHSDEVELF